MDNTIIPYQDVSDQSDSDDSDNSDDQYSQLLSNNIGIHYNNKNTEGKFMNMETKQHYESIRNKYFTPEIRKIRLLIESKNIKNISNLNTSNYTIHFENDQNNSISGYGNFNNVIGFRLIKANIFNSIYTVNNHNKHIIINNISFNLIPGSYTFNELGNHLQKRISDPISDEGAGLTGFKVINNSTTYKYKIENSNQFTFQWNEVTGYSYRLFGFKNNLPCQSDQINGIHTISSENVVQQNTQFVDLVIPEIPYIACKKNSIGKHLIDRIPLDCEQGSIMFYSSDINPNNYFLPINLKYINIQLYEDTTDLLYECQNNDNSFEFEVIILNRNF